MTTDKILKKQLEDSRAECTCLRKENELLKQKLARYSEEPAFNRKKEEPSKITQPLSTSISIHSSTDDKIVLFRSLFRGRADIYPVLWTAKDGRQGYSPACKNEWDRSYCNKKKVKCGQCKNRSLIPVSNQTIFNHLSGKHTIGVYPLLADETCWFLAIDFDKEDWQSDITAFLQTCKTYGIPTAVERSRSGNGGHVWIFFEDNVSAALARKLGFALLTLTMDQRQTIPRETHQGKICRQIAKNSKRSCKKYP